MDIEKLDNRSFLFFSNSLEALFEDLKVTLFMPDSDVFSNRMIIVPNQEIQRWIQFKLAKDLKIAANLRFSFLKQAIDSLSSLFFDCDELNFFQNSLELTLKIEKELKEFIVNDLRFEKIASYVKGKESRLLSISKHLAKHFQKYGIYGKKVSENWEKNPLEWQHVLWHKVFETKKYPLKVLPFLTLKKDPPEDFSIHIFGFNHLSPLYFNFFQKVGTSAPLFFYQLSFCQEFWSDLPSHRQAQNLEESYLDEGHPLLASFGGLSKKMAKMIEEEEENLNLYETYVPPNGETALSKLQKGLFYLQNEELKEDDSIQIHASPTRHREVQNLKNTLLFLMKEKNLSPKDIQILAPDISLYAPFIRHYFEAYQISDLPLRQKNKQIQALFLLLELDRKRWSAPYLLEIFETPLFLEKMKWHKEDLVQIKSWVQKAGIRWGYDAENKTYALEAHPSEEKEEIATWKKGLISLFYELATEESFHLEFSSATLLGELGLVLDKLNQIFLEKREKKRLKDWTLFLKNLMDEFFANSEDRKPFFELLDRFAKASPESYFFETVEDLLKEWVDKETWVENPNQLQVMHFSSIGPMKALPHKVICLLGLNDSFPKKEMSSSFDLLKKSQDYCPTLKDLDQNFFLEACVSAKETLILSYLKEEPPSPCISAVLSLFSSKKVISHPARSYDSKYFDGKNPDLKNGSWQDYELAQKFSKKRALSSFFIHEKETNLPQGTFEVDIGDLLKSLRSPLRHYLTHAYSCKLREEEDLKDEEEFTLSPLTSSILRKSFFEKVQAKDLPSGYFGKLAAIQIEKEKIELIQNLKNHDLQNVVLREGRKSEEAIYCQPLQVQVSEKLTVHLTGKIENIFSQGLISLDKSSLQNSAKMWPLFVIATSLKDLPKEFQMESLFFVKDQIEKKRFFSDAKSFLRAILELYFVSQKKPFLLSPYVLEPILKHDFAKLEKRIFQENFDPYLDWAVRGRDLNPIEAGKLAHEFSQKIYQEMADAWF